MKKHLGLGLAALLLCSCSSPVSNPLDFTYTVKEADAVRISWNGNSFSASEGDILAVKEKQVSLETPSKAITSVSYAPTLKQTKELSYTSETTGVAYKFSCFYIKEEKETKSSRVKRVFTGKVSVSISETTSLSTVYTDANEKEWNDDREYQEIKGKYEADGEAAKYFDGVFMALITEEEVARYQNEGGTISFTPFWTASWGDKSKTKEQETTSYSMDIILGQGE